MNTETFKKTLQELNNSSADVTSSAIISTDGVIIAAQIPSNLDEDRVGAMSAAMISLGKRTAEELERGKLEQVLIKGESGYVLMVSAGKNAALAVLAKKNANLGLIFFDVKKASQKISLAFQSEEN